MAKKKASKTSMPKEPKSKAKPAAAAAPAAHTEAHAECHHHHDTACLTGEVQTFLDKRDELAQKLAREIEITEKKLAELKHSAAMLYPDKDEASYSENESASAMIGLH